MKARPNSSRAPSSRTKSDLRPRVHSHRGGKVRNQPGNLKTGRSRFLDDALTAEVDRLHQDFIPVPVLPINGRGDYCRGKAGQRSNLNDAARRENTNEGREKKIILRTNSSRMPDILQAPPSHGENPVPRAEEFFQRTPRGPRGSHILSQTLRKNEIRRDRLHSPLTLGHGRARLLHSFRTTWKRRPRGADRNALK